MRKYGIVLLFTAFILVLAACGGSQKKVVDAPILVEVTDDEKVANDKVVAIVDGEEVTGEFYNMMYLQMKTEELAKTGKEIDLEQLKSATLESIIHDILTVHLGKADGLVVTEEEVDESITHLKRIGAEGYENLLEQFNYTEETIRFDFEVELMREKYIDKHIEVSVTEEEVEDEYELIYDRTAEAGKEIPEFIDSIAQIKSVLEIEKAKAEADKHVDAFRETVEIEIKL